MLMLDPSRTCSCCSFPLYHICSGVESCYFTSVASLRLLPSSESTALLLHAPTQASSASCTGCCACSKTRAAARTARRKSIACWTRARKCRICARRSGPPRYAFDGWCHLGGGSFTRRSSVAFACFMLRLPRAICACTGDRSVTRSVFMQASTFLVCLPSLFF